MHAEPLTSSLADCHPRLLRHSRRRYGPATAPSRPATSRCGEAQIDEGRRPHPQALMALFRWLSYLEFVPELLV
jgi:hypothetical protein